MFDNIGEKIKALAKVSCWIGIIIFVILGFFIASIDEEFVILGIIIIVVGALICWISSFTLYGFGEIIEQLQFSNRNMNVLYQFLKQLLPDNEKKTEKKKSYLSSPETPIKKNTDSGWNCKKCGTNNDSNTQFCKDCGTYK